MEDIGNYGYTLFRTIPCSALTAYCFFDNKPEALPVYVEKSKQLELFTY